MSGGRSRDEPTLYILVNQDLKMSRGKLGAQIGHAVQDIVSQALKQTYHPSRRRLSFDLSTYHGWDKGSSRKIILKAPQAVLQTHLDDPDSVAVYDEGRTEVEPDSLTVIAWFPTCDGKTRFSGYSLL
jgi:PTH2 family peptidyl-tRNA hydrolase